MLACIPSQQFLRDVAECKDRGWSMAALREALAAVVPSDAHEIPALFRARPLSGPLAGAWAVAVRSNCDPPSRTWLVLFRLVPNGVILLRTGRCVI